MALNKKQLEKLEELRSKATQGEWRQAVSHNCNYIWSEDLDKYVVTASGWVPEVQDEWGILTKHDAEYIATLHNSLPDLIRLARAGMELREEVERMGVVGEYRNAGRRAVQKTWYNQRDQAIKTYDELTKDV